MSENHFANIQTMIRDRVVNEREFIEDLHQLLETYVLPIEEDRWFSTKDEIQPLYTNLLKSVNDFMDSEDAMQSLVWKMCGSGQVEEWMGDLRAALQEGYYPMPSLSEERLELAEEIAELFKKNDLVIESDANSLFVRFLTEVLKATGHEYDAHQLAKERISNGE